MKPVKMQCAVCDLRCCRQCRDFMTSKGVILEPETKWIVIGKIGHESVKQVLINKSRPLTLKQLSAKFRKKKE